MSSFSIEGNKRHGKNVLSTEFGIWCALRVSKRDERGAVVSFTPLYANYNIYGYPNFIRFNKPEELATVQNAVVIYDEIAATGDARTWGSRGQILLTHKFAQMEKDGVTLIYTCQRDYLVEKRIRQQTDYVVECYKHPLSGVMTQAWYDTTRGRQELPKPPGKLIGVYRVNPVQSYSHYNTFEHVESNVNFDDMVSNQKKPKWKPKPKWKGGENL